MEQIIAYLVQADTQLEQISVKGADAYALVNARLALKTAYDECCKLNTKQEEVADDAG